MSISFISSSIIFPFGEVKRQRLSFLEVYLKFNFVNYVQTYCTLNTEVSDRTYAVQYM